MSIKLDKNQIEATKGSAGQLLIIACPGSGKTTTLLHRINRMISEDGVNPRNILMVTFTKAAAGEMRERFTDQFGIPGVTFRTIHGHCYWILRQVTGNAPEMIDEKLQNDFFLSLIKNDKSIEEKAEWVQNIKLEISNYKVSRMRQIDYKPNNFKNKSLLFSVYSKYEAYKEVEGLRDFDDLLLDTYNYLEHNPDTLQNLQKRFSYILVDEYQDVNELQRDLIYLLAGSNGNLSVVGDDDQSIYGFQGASPDIMLNFRKAYPDCRIVKIGTNYRSSKEIINIATKLIDHNKSRFTKDFKENRGQKGKPLLKLTETRNDEIEFIISQLRFKIKNQIPLTDVAILYRNNWQARQMAQALGRVGIPYTCRDVIVDAYSHWIFRDIKCFINLARGMATREEIKRIINRPNRFLREDGLLDNGIDEHYMQNVIAGSTMTKWQKEKAEEKIEEFCYFERVLASCKSPQDILNTVYEVGEYGKYLQEFAAYSGADLDEYKEIFEELEADASEYDTAEEWLNGYKDKKHRTYNPAGVTLSTIHSSKGLEWKSVYILDCADKICPSERALNREEERRLFYVAITRAKDELTLILPGAIRNKKTKPSPFLYECQLLERPRAKTKAEIIKEKQQISKVKGKYGVSKEDKYFNKYK